MRVSQLLSSPVSVNREEISGEIYLDIETLRLSHEVAGGWSNIKDFGLAVAITWDLDGQYRAWFESDASDLIEELHKFPRIVTYNGDRFDFEVLRGYGEVRTLRGKSFDVLAALYKQLGHRVKLDHVVSQTLGVSKTGDGLQSVEWWRRGEKDKVVEYCCHDVELLLRLVAHARETGEIVIDGRRIKVDWRPFRRKTQWASAGR